MALCKKCVLPDTYPGIKFNNHGVCNFCEEFDSVRSTEKMHFENEGELIKCLEKFKGINNKYDVLVPLSGGVDSSYTLINVVRNYKLRPLAYHNDHGYESETATENVKKLCRALDVDLVIIQQDLEFMKKLWKYVNESHVKGLTSCFVCGNILYLNAIEVADRFNIKLIVNGYSKGQAEMTNDKSQGINMIKHMQDIIRQRKDREFYNKFMDKYNIMSKVIAYKSRYDMGKKVELDKILVIPFYIVKFYKTDKEQLKNEIRKVFDWQQINNSYPSRTTNCVMNWLGSMIDNRKMGFSVYEPEYAELVRVGEMTREQALCDLEFTPPEGLINKLAKDLDIDLESILKSNI